MKLFEYQVKAQFKTYSIPMPRSKIALSIDDAYQAIGAYRGRVVMKPQMGYAHTKTQEFNDITEAYTFADIFFKRQATSTTPMSMLIEQYHQTQQRIYIRFKIDRSSCKTVLSISTENHAQARVYHKLIHPFLGLRQYQTRDLASDIDLERDYWREFIRILDAAYQCYKDYDAELLEISPLGLIDDGQFLALNAHLHIDNNALFRQTEFSTLQSVDNQPQDVLRAKQSDVSYVPLGGQIACIANGAGLAMALMDTIHHLSNGELHAASFLDIGGVARADKIDDALKIVLSQKNVQAIVINIFGGITRCDEIAQGIIDAYEGIPPQRPIIIRLAGNQAQNALRLIRAVDIANVYTVDSLEETVHAILKAMRSQNVNTSQ